MTLVSEAYARAEAEMEIPPVAERGRRNLNPDGIGFWALVAEDFRTHGSSLWEPGFWALFTCRFGNWRMDQPKLVRAPATLLYYLLLRLVETFGGVSLWYTTKIGRRVRIWHHSGMVLGARAIGDDVQLRQNTTLGVARTGVNDELPILCDGVDIGAGACIVGAVVLGRGARVGGNALVIEDVPPGATVIGNPAQVVAVEDVEDVAAAAPAPILAPVSDPVSAPASPVITASPVAHVTVPDEPMRGAVQPLGRIAVLGSANLDLLGQAFEAEAARFGLEVTAVVPEFGTARMELLKEAEASPLQQAMVGGDTATLIVERAEDVLGDAATSPLGLSPEEAEAHVAAALAPMLQTVQGARGRLRGPVFVTRLAAFERSPLGLADGAEPRGRQALIDRANALLAEAVAGLDDVHLIDMAALVAEMGQQAAAPAQFWHLGRMPFSEGFNGLLARRVIGGLLSLRGKTARILMIDLDNTLWGGVLGEDGIEGVALGGAYPGTAYVAFQQAIRALAARGIALALTSKNDEDLALQMLGEHPEMVLRPGDFVAHRIDWSEKALNIQEMLDEIGLGAGSAMFIDDNPVERAKVRKNLPEAIVPPFPAAPEDLAGWLLDNPYLDCLALTASDLKRTDQYKVRAKVNAAKRDFENIEEFYRDLGMRLTFEPVGPMNAQRVQQLFVKTNQFNATTRRHDAGALQRLLAAGAEIYAVGVEDRHSPYELMGVLVLAPDGAMVGYDDPMVAAARRDGAWWVESFVMSCRILGRSIETAILAWATGRVAELGGTALIGQVIETPRNSPVRKVFGAAGFVAGPEVAEQGAGGLWLHDLSAGPLPVADYFEVSAEAAPVFALRGDGAAPVVAPPAPVVSGASAPVASVDPRLDAVVRQVLQLGPEVDLTGVSMETTAAWGSLTHLKLIMAVERGLGLKLPGHEIASLRSIPDLAAAVARQAA